MLSPARPTDCRECREMAEDNKTIPDCSKCSMPRETSAMNDAAWEVWSVLDSHGRDLDTMAGNPLPLRLEAIALECSRHSDPDGIRWRVLLIEDQVLAYRRENQKKKGGRS